MGCIIRAVFLEDITQAFMQNPGLENLLMDPNFKEKVNARQESWRRVVTQAIASGIATPAFSGSLAYYDSYRRERLPGNIIQAQRDFSGAEMPTRPTTPPASSSIPNGRTSTRDTDSEMPNAG